MTSSFLVCICGIIVPMEKLTQIAAFDTVATLAPINRDRLKLLETEFELIQQLPRGQVGTILEVYPGESPCYLVEFADLQGHELAMAVLQPNEVMAIRYEISQAANV
jgi:hypothetical protein